METVTFDQSQTKLCPFCAETIQAKAIKCRFCGEFLNPKKVQALEADYEEEAEEPEDEKEELLFAGRPSLWGIAGALFKGTIFLCIAGFLIYFPVENLSVFLPGESSFEDHGQIEYEQTWSEKIESRLELTAEQIIIFAKYRVIFGLGLLILVILILFMKMLRLKMIYYEVTEDRIEYSRGIFDRRVDNLDMFRVIDLNLRRSLFDCLVGVGTVGLITSDKSDPEFEFEKIRGARDLYDIIKKSSLEADRKNGVVHLEQ